jgi:hypothetical protein
MSRSGDILEFQPVSPARRGLHVNISGGKLAKIQQNWQNIFGFYLVFVAVT